MKLYVNNTPVYAVKITGNIKFEASTIKVAQSLASDNSFVVAGDYTEDVKKGDVITKIENYNATSVAKLKYYLYKYKEI